MRRPAEDRGRQDLEEGFARGRRAAARRLILEAARDAGVAAASVRLLPARAVANEKRDAREGLSMAGDFDLTGRVAIVTGGNGGIGLGMAMALAQAGCAVSIWGRNPEKNRAALAELHECGARVEARTIDVTDRAAIEDAFAGTLQAFGRVDGCFANAGMGAPGKQAFVDRSEDEWRRMFATNLDGVFHVFQVAVRHMIKRAEGGDRFGRLVATSSLASLFGMPRGEHYAATKAALNELV